MNPPLQPIAMLCAVLLAACGPDRSSPGPDPDPDPEPAVTDFDTCAHPNDLVAHEQYLYVVCGEQHDGPDSQPVAAGGSRSVNVHTYDGGLVAQIPIAAGGHRATIIDNTMYIAHFSLDHVITEIDLNSNTAVEHGGLSANMRIIAPDAIDASPDGKYVYIGNNAGMDGTPRGWISRLDRNTGVLDTEWNADTGGVICDVKSHPDSQTIYSVAWTDGVVTRASGLDGAILSATDAVADIEPFSHSMIFGPPAADGSYVIYVLVSQGNRVVKLDEQLNHLDEIAGPWNGHWRGPVDPELSANGYLYINNFNHAGHAHSEPGEVAVLDVNPSRATFETVVKTFTVGNDPIFSAISGDYLFVSNNADGTVSRIDISELENRE